MGRFFWPVASSLFFSTGGALGILYERARTEADSDSEGGFFKSKSRFFTHAAAARLQNPPAQGPTPQSRSGEIMKFGFPDYGQIQMHENYVISYDRRMRNARWVFECLTRDEVKYNDAITRTNCEFEADQSVHAFFRSTNEDYRGSGYDRGHMAAAANHRRSDGVMQQTFLLSNVSPQVGKGFNRGVWNDLEKYVRSLTKRYTRVYVCTGPLYLPIQEPNKRLYVKYEVIGTNSVAVPTHFFKVVLGETQTQSYDLRAFVVPNRAFPEDTPLKKFLVPVNVIERAAGILLFERLPQNMIRSINAPL